MKDRSVVLVSHAVSLVAPRADFIVVVENGTVVASGTLDQVSTVENCTITPDVVESFEAVDECDENKRKKVTFKDQRSDGERKESGKLCQEEEVSTGSVKLSVYWSYIKAAGGFWFLLILFLVCLF